MATYFAGSSYDALVPSLANTSDGADFVSIGGGGYVDAYVTDPADGLRKGVKRLWSHVTSSSADYGPSNGLVMYSWLNAAGKEIVRFPNLNGGRAFQILQPDNSWKTYGEIQNSRSGTYDFLIVVHPTAGRLAWFFNGNLAVDLRNIDTSAIGDVARFRLQRMQDYVGGTTHQGILLASYNTIGHTVRRRAPNANGSRMTWSGSFADVDDTGNDDTNAISASTVGDLATFKASAFTPTTAGNVIKAVAVAARIRNYGDVIPTNARAILSIGGQDFQAPTNMPITAGFAGSVALFENDPTTGKPWTDIANVNGEFGLLAIE